MDKTTKTMYRMIRCKYVSLERCMQYYVCNFLDTDVQNQHDIEEIIRDLDRDWNEDHSDEIKRLNKMLDDNPACFWFDYYNEKPILSKDWLYAKFGMKKEVA